MPTRSVDAVFARLLAAGLRNATGPDSPVHRGPVDRSWGAREFYLDDPGGNTLRFVERG